jgi:hypothetical protein
MAEEDTKVDGSQIDGNDTDDSQTEDKDTTPQSDGEFMEETVDFIKEIQKAELGEDDSDLDGDGDSDVLPELRGKDIPDEYTEAAEAAGMSKDEIIKYANKHTDEELLEEAQSIKDKLEQLDKKSEAKEGDKVIKQGDEKDKDGDDKDKVIDPKVVAAITEKISKELADKFGTTLEELDKFKAHQQEQSARQTVETASKIFDEANEKYPVFGKTDELPRYASGRLAGELIRTSPEVKARMEVLSDAEIFMSKGADIDYAMAKAIATYKGMHLEKESKRNAIRDLKQHETKLSGARVGRETKKKYVDTRDEIIDDIRQMQRQAGVD